MGEEYFIDDELCDLVVEMAHQDEAKTMALLCGLLIGLAEAHAEGQGQNPKSKMELVGAPRTITISAAGT